MDLDYADKLAKVMDSVKYVLVHQDQFDKTKNKTNENKNSRGDLVYF